MLPMKAGITAVFVNLVFNYILIYGKFGAPQLGVVGAAAATVLSRYVEMAIVLIRTHGNKEKISFYEASVPHDPCSGGFDETDPHQRNTADAERNVLGRRRCDPDAVLLRAWTECRSRDEYLQHDLEPVQRRFHRTRRFRCHHRRTAPRSRKDGRGKGYRYEADHVFCIYSVL